MNIAEGTIGIFWEYKESEFSRLLDPFNFGRGLLELSRSLSSFSRLSRVQVFVEACEEYFVETLSGLGYEVKIVANDYERVSTVFISSILLWLWDCERTKAFSGNPVVIIVPSNPEILPTLERLKLRNVEIVVAIDTLVTDRAAWEPCASFVMDVNEIGLSYSQIDHSKPSNIPESAQEEFSSMRLGSDPLRFSSAGNPSNGYLRNTLQNQIQPSSLIPVEPFETFERDSSRSKQGDKKINEQKKLFDELSHALRTKNVQVTVSTLRKIYTKQTIGFRIQEILMHISQINESQLHRGMAGSEYLDTKFLLECIQWCFGGQRDDNFESFTYKMNKKIAKWLLKEVQRKDLTPQLREQLRMSTVSVCQSILRQVPEFELVLDLLVLVELSKPINILLPFVSTWRKSLNPVVRQRVSSFAQEFGIPMTGRQADSLSGGAVPAPYGLRDTSSENYSRDSKWNLADASHFSLSRQQSSLTGILDMEVVKGRLLAILRKSPFGALESRIRDMYAVEFGEPLPFHSLMLRDLLLGLGCVKIIGSQGTDDKVFRLVETNK